MINQDKYILDPGHEDYNARVTKLHHQFRNDGVCVLEDFVNRSTINTIVREATQAAENAYHSFERSNPYLKPIDPSGSKDNVLNMEGISRLRVIAYDEITTNSKLRELYNHPHLTHFIRDIVGLDQLYQYGCPLGALNMAVMSEGDSIRWHFDISNFVVTLALQNPIAGGEFEYISNFRTKDDPNHKGVKEVLLGERSEVKPLKTYPGSLVIFQGVNTLHRVSSVQGATPRINALLGYDREPGKDSSEFVKKMRYGRTDSHVDQPSGPRAKQL